METKQWRYRAAGVIGGLMLAAGQFWGPACVLQAGALGVVLWPAVRDRRVGAAAMAGLYMGIFYTLPQMVYLLMPVPVTAILLVWTCALLTGLCAGAAFLLRRGGVWGALAVGAVWFLLDAVNVSAVPIWGLAQSFGRSWTAWPGAIGFIEWTGISGVVFVLGTAQALGVTAMRVPAQRRGALIALGIVLGLVSAANVQGLLRKPAGTIRVAAAGWVFDDRSSEVDPHKAEGFEQLFAGPARAAAATGAAIFTTGEMGFYIADHERAMWMERFGTVAKETGMWLVVGYWNISADENRLFFMSPDGAIVHEYTKTYLTPYEPGKKGTGDLRTVEVAGVTVGAMICQDDNFMPLTRYYGKLKADVVLCPTADWWTIRVAHLQAVRARAIEGRYGIARGAANGISAIIGPRGDILAQRDHTREGAGWIAADVPVMDGVTGFSRWGMWPGIAVSVVVLAMGGRWTQRAAR